MLYANSGQEQRMEAFPGGTGRCPLCDGEVRARCGQVNAWHWAHVSGVDCDTWAEPETEWHRAYKRTVPLGQREVRMGSHRADLVSHDGFVVELQHSSLPAEDIQAREQHYQKMVWLFDARDAYYRGRLMVRTKPGTDYVTFRWKQPRRSIALCRKRVLLDLGLGLVLSIRKIYPGPPFSGWGHLLETLDIWRWMLAGIPPRPIDLKRHGTASLADRILQYGDYLAAGPTPSPPEEIGLMISAAMIPSGKQVPSEFQATIKGLSMIGSCPPGLSHLGDGALYTAGIWCGAARIQVTCPHCGQDSSFDHSQGQDEPGTALWQCHDCRKFCVLGIPTQGT